MRSTTSTVLRASADQMLATAHLSSELIEQAIARLECLKGDLKSELHHGIDAAQIVVDAIERLRNIIRGLEGP